MCIFSTEKNITSHTSVLTLNPFQGWRQKIKILSEEQNQFITSRPTSRQGGTVFSGQTEIIPNGKSGMQERRKKPQKKSTSSKWASTVSNNKHVSWGFKHGKLRSILTVCDAGRRHKQRILGLTLELSRKGKKVLGSWKNAGVFSLGNHYRGKERITAKPAERMKCS